MFRNVARFGALGLVIVAAAACGSELDGELGSGSSTEQALQQPRICPAIAILCADGYRPKQLPNCNQICVPDQQDWECDQDKDCGAIYCFTTPCPQPVCRGHQCMMGTTTPDPSGGEVCGDSRCGANAYCCNASCGICAPDGGACIQIACLQE